jgi:Methyltransferase small domain
MVSFRYVVDIKRTSIVLLSARKRQRVDTGSGLIRFRSQADHANCNQPERLLDCAGFHGVTTILWILLIPLIPLALIVYWSLSNGISPTPSSRKQIREILRAIPKEFSGTIYDLGSGWGTLAIALAKRRPNCKITGVENSIVPYLVSELLLRFLRIHTVEFHFADFLKYDFRDADMVVCYLYPGGMRKLKPKLEADLNPGTIVISNTFAISGWEPVEVLRSNDMYRSPIYRYTKERR